MVLIKYPFISPHCPEKHKGLKEKSSRWGKYRVGVGVRVGLLIYYMTIVKRGFEKRIEYSGGVIVWLMQV